MTENNKKKSNNTEKNHTKDFKEYFIKKAINRSFDIATINRGSLKRILNAFKKLSNSQDYAYFFNKYNEEEKAEFLLNLLSNNYIPNKYNQFLQTLDKTIEINYRNFSSEKDIDFDELKIYIDDLYNETKSLKTAEQINKRFILEFLIFRDMIGNPMNWITCMQTKENNLFLWYPSEEMFINFMLTYNDLVIPKIKFDFLDNTNIFNPSDVFLELANNTLDEILFMINSFFDSHFYFLKDIEKLKQVINKLDSINKQYYVHPFNNNSNCDSYYGNSILTILDSRNNRDYFFESLLFLSNTKNYANDTFYNNNKDNIFNNLQNRNEYSVNYLKNMRDIELINYISESDIGIKGFNKHRKIIIDLVNALEKLNANTNIYSPNITISLNLNNLLDFKILYHEFFSLKNDYKFYINSTKQYSTQCINTVNILKMIILTVNKYNKFLNDDDLKKYGNNYNKYIFDKQSFYYDCNEDSNLVYKINTLLSEKIRRGYFREFNLMENYKIIFNYKMMLRKTLTNIFYHPNLEMIYIATINLYKDIFSQLMEIDLKQKDSLASNQNQ